VNIEISYFFQTYALFGREDGNKEDENIREIFELK